MFAIQHNLKVKHFLNLFFSVPSVKNEKHISYHKSYNILLHHQCNFKIFELKYILFLTKFLFLLNV